MSVTPESNESTLVGGNAASGSPGGYRTRVLILLTIAYALSTIDRNIIGVINEAIKVDLKLTDTQIGLLGGISFALLYTFLGIPIARLAERYNRVSIISAALFLWSGFTGLCGFAGSFLQLAALRVGVGFGEAGLTPPAHSLISDYYEPKKRSTALSVYAFGIPLGAILGGVLGGWLAKTFGWRVAFMAVGAPGLIMAIVMKLAVKEPVRGQSDGMPGGPRREKASLPPVSFSSEMREIGAVVKGLYGNWTFFNLIFGLTIVSFSYAGAGQFTAPYFIRQFGLDYATVGLIVGLAGGVSGGAGTLLGGFLADLAGKRNVVWYTLLPAFGIILGTILYMFAYTAPTWHMATILLIVPGLFYYSFLGPTFGLVQNGFDTRRRATAVALIMFSVSLVGHGLGPPFTGWIIDHFANWGINNPGSAGLGTEIARAAQGSGAGTLSFSALCPGGSAADPANQTMVATCSTILKQATRDGVIASYLFSFWGAAHFMLASIGLKKHLDKRQHEVDAQDRVAA